MNKPSFTVCSAVSDSHKTIYSLLPKEMQKFVQGAKRGERLHTVGRLDADTEGLIILTNDGFFSNEIAGPLSSVEKTYQVTLKNKVEKEVQEEYKKLAKNGIILPAEKKAPKQLTKPFELEFLNENECLITIKEGKFHQVKRTFLALENEVLYLKRIRIGKLFLPEDLSTGEFKISFVKPKI